MIKAKIQFADGAVIETSLHCTFYDALDYCMEHTQSSNGDSPIDCGKDVKGVLLVEL